MRRFIKKLSRARRCPLCEQGTVIGYKEVPILKKYISERGKILGRARSGICATHQRQVTNSIKRARYVALMPFVQS
ncbi:30S ribosomal protein S18 [Candidatus Curtissbacteria bacterium RBG_13_35_7]|uniref:Small ribosomal subunit protein bS18 n=1 Tax=Candidatus Curtissbacteria bacterium RBG_13_35_7 TaxID=1797705 RepID=A0A1F5G3Q5_9BACT|nr:MAG: 30S ribosomal protein S18 [Candidatus Curtissbacteria bacterium RBG_13_35_7]